MRAIPKPLDVLTFILALSAAIFVSSLLFTNWFQWQISIKDKDNTHRVEMLSDKLNMSDSLEETNFPDQNANIYSLSGECIWGEVALETSPNDRLKEYWILWASRFAIISSYASAVVSLINMVRIRRKKFLTKTLFLLVGLAIFFTASRFLGPKGTISPFFTNEIDFNCHYNLVVNARLIWINPQALVLLGISILLVFITIALFFRSLSLAKA